MKKEEIEVFSLKASKRPTRFHLNVNQNHC